MLRRRQFSLMQLVAVVTAVAALIALIRYLLPKDVPDTLAWWLEALVVMLVFAIMPVATCWTLFYAIRQTLFWPKASAVVRRHYITRHEGQAFYHPVLRFGLYDGSIITTISRWGSRRRRWNNSDAVTVRYNPANPHWAEVETFAVVWGMPLACFTLTIVGALSLLWFR
jgi:amino acid transporter